MKSAVKTDTIKYIAFVSLIFAVFVSVCVFFIFNFYFTLTTNNQEYFNELASETANSIESKLDSALNTLSDFSRSFANFDTLSNEEQGDILNTVNDIGTFYDIAYINLNGEAKSQNYGEAVLSRRDYFRYASIGIRNVSSAVISDFTGEKLNVFAVPVHTKEKITGVLAGAMKIDFLSLVMETGTFEGKASNYIMNTEGLILIIPQTDMLNLDEGVNLFSTIETVSDNDYIIREEIAQRNANGSFVFSKNGEQYFASYESINVSDWIVLTIASSDDIYSVTLNIFSMVLVFTISFMVAVTIGILVASIYRIKMNKRFHETATERDILKNTDILTGSPSYDKFISDVKEAVSRFNESNLAMLSMDINKFRAVNDLLGHDDGSKVLIKLSQVIQRSLTRDETFTRKNADTFYILLNYETDADIFRRLDTIINDAYYQITEFKLVLIFGIYKIDDVAMDIRSMIDRADLARRTIKNQNESTYAFFDNNMISKIREEKAIENVMEQALESNQFKVYLQPKYDLHDRSMIIGAEALVRWFRDGKMIPPGAFIPLFEKNGFILRIDKFVFEEVCKQQKIWLSRGYDMRIISVNMSRIHLSEPNFVRDLYDICTKYNVPTKYFEIEITESVAFENLEVLSQVFNELKNYGFHISIDDFGTGYSSLNMLKDLPVDVLKIDRAFLTDSGKNERASQIISHVISLALSLHMKTICEGIETLDQVTLLSELGCDMAQGFYFARPMPIEDYEKLLYNDVKLMN